MKDTTTLAYVIQAILDQEYGDLRSILDEVYPSPREEVLPVLYNLLYMVKGASFLYRPDTGWEYSAW